MNFHVYGGKMKDNLSYYYYLVDHGQRILSVSDNIFDCGSNVVDIGIMNFNFFVVFLFLGINCNVEDCEADKYDCSRNSKDNQPFVPSACSYESHHSRHKKAGYSANKDPVKRHI